jgi:hypothetical protein
MKKTLQIKSACMALPPSAFAKNQAFFLCSGLAVWSQHSAHNDTTHNSDNFKSMPIRMCHSSERDGPGIELTK